MRPGCLGVLILFAAILGGTCGLVLRAEVKPTAEAASPRRTEAATSPRSASSSGPRMTPRQEAFFENHIRPLLVAKCLECHGPQAQKGGLRLDTFAALQKGGDSGPVIETDDPAASRLLEVLSYHDPVRMPPQGKLRDQEIAALDQWVRMGALFPEKPLIVNSESDASSRARAAKATHWAYRPVKAVSPPIPRRHEWCRNDIDRFVLAKLEAHGLAPSAPADKRTLLRRATFDLIGLPPTPAELADFESDRSPRAFAKVVDRLLASPHYGERWGRYWLDVARYADTKGYVFFEEPNFPWAYTYRDYVVRAFNNDLPYDRFVLEQLAADQLDLGNDKQALAALGFLTLGGKFLNNPHDVADDRIDVVTRGFLGLTVQCARCHDHKYDPISMADYYGLYGVFRSASEPALLPDISQRVVESEHYEFFEQELAVKRSRLEQFLHEKHTQVCAHGRSRAAEYLYAAHIATDQPSMEDFMQLANPNDLNPTMQVRWSAYLNRMRRQPHAVWGLWHELSRLPEGDFPAAARKVMAGFSVTGSPGRVVNPLVLKALAARPLATMRDVCLAYAGALLDVERMWQAKLQAARNAGQTLPHELDDPAAEELREVFHGPNAPPDMPQLTGWGVLSLLPDRQAQGVYQELLKGLEKWCTEFPDAPPRAHVLEESFQPFSPRIYLRGNPNRPGPRVERQFLEVLRDSPEVFSHGGGRLDLARKIVDPKNPLTARVMVNRVWLNHFGKGFVATAGDFGVRCDAPAHRELFDWLATRFVQSGWSVKQLHREIMLSATYQQASDDRDRERLADPENHWLWKMNRRRLDFEGLRDSLLYVAGTLDAAVGGPPGTLDDRRRTLYAQVDRMNLPGLFRIFDFPSPESLSPQRDTTTIPPQSLYLMNNPFAQSAAEHCARRPEITRANSPPERVNALYLLLFSRRATAREQEWAAKFLGVSPSAENWSEFAQALLLTNEFAFVD